MRKITLLVASIKLFRELKRKVKFGSVLAVALAFVIFAAGCAQTSTDTSSSLPESDATLSVGDAIEPTTQTQDTDSPSTDDPGDVSSEVPDNPVPDNTADATEPEPAPGVPEQEQPPAPPTISPASTFSIHFIDVGQADAALIECDGHYMLIDGGNKSDSSRIYAILKNANVSELDIVVGTHAHEDHIGGLPGAYNYTTAALTLCPVTDYDSEAFEDFKKYAEKNGGGITVPSVGDTYTLGSATVTILGLNAADAVNDTSIVLRIDYGATSFLFAGDAEYDAEHAILDNGANLSATVLKVGHHGSDTSTSYVWLREIMPQYAVISVGEGNSYGHPTEPVLSRLRDADVSVYRTDLQGDIYCTSDGQTVIFSVERNADADTLSPPKVEKPVVETPPTVPPVDDKEEDTTTEQEPTGTDYVGNKNPSSMKFHYSWCNSVKQMKESNKFYYTGTRDEMIAMGYVPCKSCSP